MPLPPAPDAVDLRDRLAAGSLSATDLARACLDRARATEGTLRAFAWLDEGHVLAEAARLDRLRAAGHEVVLVECGWPRGGADLEVFGGSPTVSRALLAVLRGEVAP